MNKNSLVDHMATGEFRIRMSGRFDKYMSNISTCCGYAIFVHRYTENRFPIPPANVKKNNFLIQTGFNMPV